MSIIRYCVALVCVMGVVGCERTASGPAPVVDAWQQAAAQKSTYRVQPSDTLYSIAWSYQLDYKKLAVANGLVSPYRLRVGQVLSMNMSAVPKAPVPSVTLPSQPSMHVQPSASPALPVLAETGPVRWGWPTQGRLAAKYQSGAGNKGIDLAGGYGQPVRAAAYGMVVYSGAGVRGYGNLIIIKHNTDFLSAYAFNKDLLVRTGDMVKKGQMIAHMGRNTAGQSRLHFEIRHKGRPVNPLIYLR